MTDTAEKADLHNQQFQSVFTTKAPLSLSRLCQIQIQDMTDWGKMRHDAVPDRVLNTNPKIEEFSISCNGILKLLQNLKPFKAAGPDKLKPLLLKELREEIAPIKQVIFERSLQTGKLPADWCKAQVTPVFKKGTKSSAANYRPISLTCILCKVLEHIIASNVVKHLNAHDLLYDLQHGFREKRSCETQLTMLVEDLARSVSQGKQTDLILLDFSKAFDKVNHAKLLWKLHQYGIRGNALAWIRAFLGNRSQTVVLDCVEFVYFEECVIWFAIACGYALVYCFIYGRFYFPFLILKFRLQEVIATDLLIVVCQNICLILIFMVPYIILLNDLYWFKRFAIKFRYDLANFLTVGVMVEFRDEFSKLGLLCII